MNDRPSSSSGVSGDVIAAIVVDEEETGAAPIEQRQTDVGRDARRLPVVLNGSLQVGKARKRIGHFDRDDRS